MKMFGLALKLSGLESPRIRMSLTSCQIVGLVDVFISPKEDLYVESNTPGQLPVISH